MLRITKYLILGVLISLMLTACGGGGGSSPSAGPGPSGPSTTSNYSGVVLDGYLSNARVFLDLNGNGQYDSGEPSATTNSNGAYTLNATSAQISSNAIIVNAIAGTTVDQSNPNTPITRAYTLTAPPGYLTITPLTTQVAAQVSAGLSVSAATTAVQQQLGLTNVDLFSDYIATPNPPAHNVAAAITAVAQMVEAQSTSGTTYTATLNSINTDVASLVVPNITQIQSAASPSAAANIVTSANSHTLGGTIVGLGATGLTLTNGSETLAISSGNSSFTFHTPVADGSGYSVQIGTQPTGYTCSVSNGTGTMGAADITPVQINCAASSSGGTSPAISISPNASTLSGTVTLSISNTYPSVSWYCDTTLIGTGTGAGDTLSWNTSTVSNGTHAISAVITLSTSSSATVTVTQQVNVANSNIVINASTSGTTGAIQLNVVATSNYSISSVSATLDGASLGSLTSPNAVTGCRGCSGPNNTYQFTINAPPITSGNHTILVTVVDSSGATQSSTLTLAVANPPVLNVTSPTDGGFINGSGSLNIAGTVSTDRAGGVTVTASLGSLPISITQPTSGSFSGSLSLSGFNAGPYTLKVTAADSANVTTTVTDSIVVASSAQTTYSPLFSMGAGGQLIAVDSSNPNLILYKASDGSYRVRNTSSSAEVTLAGTSGIPFIYNWALDGGYAFVDGGFLGLTSTGYTDCPLECIYQWSPIGVKTNLSNSNPNAASSSVGGGRAYEEYPRAHGGYVIWVDYDNSARYTLYNVSSGTYTQIAQASNIIPGAVGNTNYDFAVVGGNIEFLYWASTSSSYSTYDIFKWTSATQTSTQLTSASGTTKYIYPQTDGQSVAWLQNMLPAENLSPLLVEPVAGGTPTTLSTSMMMRNFTLAGGVLAWTEGTTSTNSQGITTTTQTGLRASTTNGATSTISTASDASLRGVGGGFVVYNTAGKSYQWSSANGTSTVLIDAAPTSGAILVSGSTMYFTMGASNAVYQITLH